MFEESEQQIQGLIDSIREEIRGVKVTANVTEEKVSKNIDLKLLAREIDTHKLAQEIEEEIWEVCEGRLLDSLVSSKQFIDRVAKGVALIDGRVAHAVASSDGFVDLVARAVVLQLKEGAA